MHYNKHIVYPAQMRVVRSTEFLDHHKALEESRERMRRRGKREEERREENRREQKRRGEESKKGTFSQIIVAHVIMIIKPMIL